MNKNYRYPCFKLIDIFGIPPLFTIRGRSTFQTQIGASLTIICITFIIIYISVLLKQMTHHKSPNLNSSIYYKEKPPDMDLNKNNFSFVFGLQSKDYKNFIDDRIYNVNAYQSKLILNKNGIYNYENEPLTIIKCDEYKFEIIPDKFKKLPIDNLYCLNNNISLKGDFMQESLNYIKLNFMKCVNSTENKNKCKSEDEINEILNEGFIGMFFPDYSFEPVNFNNPYKTYVRNLYEGISMKFFENIVLYFKLVEIITDSGYFFDDKQSIYFASYDYSQNDLDLNDLINFLSITIRVSSKREVHERNYIKVQEIVSNVGGMLKIVLLFGEYSVYFIRMLLYKNYILEFFNLDESEIRLKEVRSIYKLQKNKTALNINVPNLSVITDNLINKNQPNSKEKKIHFQIINENFENKSVNSFDENFMINNNSSNKDISIHSNDKLTVPKNNYLLNSDIIQKKETKKNDPKITNTLLYKFTGNHNLFGTNINPKKNIKLNTIISTRNIFRNSKKINLSDINTLNRVYKLKNKIIIPNTQLRIIKVPGFCSDFVCKKNTLKIIKQVNENYKEIQFLLDIVHYFKSQNELNIIGKFLFTEEQRKALSYTYTFKADFKLERKGYEYMIKHKKNRFDKKDSAD